MSLAYSRLPVACAAVSAGFQPVTCMVGPVQRLGGRQCRLGGLYQACIVVSDRLAVLDGRFARSTKPSYGWHMPMARTSGPAQPSTTLRNHTEDSSALPELWTRSNRRDRNEPGSTSARAWHAPAVPS